MKPGDLVAERFRIGDAPIGQGRSGVIWPAVDEGTGRTVAIKVPHGGARADRRAADHLDAEASAAARLDHPNIVRVLGVWSVGESRVLVAERFDGHPLSGLVGALDPRATVALGRQIAAALVYAHAHGVIHGDVRPGNVLIGAGGAALFDFGAAALGADVDRRAAETAPEVLAGSPCSERADLYGLGLVLFRAATGRDAHPAGRTPTRAPETNGPKGIVALIRALLDPDPARRPTSARHALDALDALAKAPNRVPGWRGSGFAPLRPGRAWVVHGIDPATGGPAVFVAGIPRSEARSVVSRLRSRGWTVEATREALGWADLLVILGASMLVVPVFFPLAPVAAALTARLLSGACRPELRDALPRSRTPIPPIELPPFGEHLVAIGALFLATAALLPWWPVAAAIPAIASGGLIAMIATARRTSPRDGAAAARIALRLEELRREAASEPDLDAELARLGAIDAVAEAWSQGAPADRILARLDALDRSDRG